VPPSQHRKQWTSHKKKKPVWLWLPWKSLIGCGLTPMPSFDARWWVTRWCMRPQITNLRYACNGNSAALSWPIFILYPTTNPAIFQQISMISLLVETPLGFILFTLAQYIYCLSMKHRIKHRMNHTCRAGGVDLQREAGPPPWVQTAQCFSLWFGCHLRLEKLPRVTVWLLTSSFSYV